ncbi:MAG: pantetheine-phosphate adenylyltransferase [Ruminococcaceae bacterium]|nr:pantetheine-phosphate adenylyltransferase [Oscillospiraceae bacterium]
MSCAILPGSYDPITTGHLDIVKRATELYDEVIVAVMNNDQKKYLYNMEQREHMVRLATHGLERVRVLSDAGMLIDLFDRVGADVIVKGVRNDRDRVYEEQMAAWNLSHNPRAKTVLLEASEDLIDVSSTAVREMLKRGESPEEILPSVVFAYMKELERA